MLLGRRTECEALDRQLDVVRSGQSSVLVLRAIRAGRIAPGADHELGDVADVLWSHHVDRATFQTRIGFDDERG